MNALLLLKVRVFVKILAVDSSSKTASVAILDNDKLLGEIYVNIGLTHSQTLLPLIENLLKSVALTINEIDAFSITNGPGSFTGVRIGVSLIKGLAFPKNKPCIPVSTLHSLAYNLVNSDCIACAVMDAKCNQVYNAIFEITNKKITRLTPDRAILIDDLFEELKAYRNKKIVFVGDGADLCYNKKNVDFDLFIIDDSNKYQSAKSTAYIALDAFNNNEYVSSEDLQPLYLRLPQAQRLLNAKNNVL